MVTGKGVTIYNQNERARAKIIPHNHCNRTGLPNEAKLGELCVDVVLVSPAAGGGGEIGGTSHVPNVALSCSFDR